MLKYCSFILVLVSVAIPQAFAQPQAERPMLSQAAMTMQRIGLTDITVTYHRPGVKGRKIWGDLVPYNEVWRAGANEATTITFSDDVLVSGHPLKAGTYSFFIKPEKDRKWEIIFNATPKQWGAFFLNKSKNVLTFYVSPETASFQEWLLYTFTDLTMSSAKLELRWGKLAISFPIQVNTASKMAAANEEAVEYASSQLAGAALTYLEHNTNLEKALNFINRALDIHQNFENMNTKAKILGELKRYDEAIQTAETALDLQKKERNTYTNMEAWQLRRSMEKWRTHINPKKDTQE